MYMLLASFFLPSHLSFKNIYIVYIYIYICSYIHTHLQIKKYKHIHCVLISLSYMYISLVVRGSTAHSTGRCTVCGD